MPGASPADAPRNHYTSRNKKITPTPSKQSIVADPRPPPDSAWMAVACRGGTGTLSHDGSGVAFSRPYPRTSLPRCSLQLAPSGPLHRASYQGARPPTRIPQWIVWNLGRKCARKVRIWVPLARMLSAKAKWPDHSGRALPDRLASMKASFIAAGRDRVARNFAPTSAIQARTWAICCPHPPHHPQQQTENDERVLLPPQAVGADRSNTRKGRTRNNNARPPERHLPGGTVEADGI